MIVRRTKKNETPCHGEIFLPWQSAVQGQRIWHNFPVASRIHQAIVNGAYIVLLSCLRVPFLKEMNSNREALLIHGKWNLCYRKFPITYAGEFSNWMNPGEPAFFLVEIRLYRVSLDGFWRAFSTYLSILLPYSKVKIIIYSSKVINNNTWDYRECWGIIYRDDFTKGT